MKFAIFLSNYEGQTSLQMEQDLVRASSFLQPFDDASQMILVAPSVDEQGLLDRRGSIAPEHFVFDHSDEASPMTQLQTAARHFNDAFFMIFVDELPTDPGILSQLVGFIGEGLSPEVTFVQPMGPVGNFLLKKFPIFITKYGCDKFGQLDGTKNLYDFQHVQLPVYDGTSRVQQA